MLERTLRKDRTEVTFVLPADTPPGPVSVVGDFNDWQPGAHTLRPAKTAKRAVTVELPARARIPSGTWRPGTTGSTTRRAGDQDGPNSRLHT